MPLPTSSCHPIVDAREIASTRLVELFDYWRAKSQTRLAPARQDIDPRDIPRLLPWIWLIDVVDGGADFRFRLGGQKLIEFLGRRVCDNLISSQMQTPFFATVAESLALCVREKKPLLRERARTTYELRNYLETETPLLPLSDNGASVSQILGGFEMTSPIAPHPDDVPVIG